MKKLFSIVLTIALIISSVPAAAFAEERSDAPSAANGLSIIQDQAEALDEKADSEGDPDKTGVEETAQEPFAQPDDPQTVGEEPAGSGTDKNAGEEPAGSGSDKIEEVEISDDFNLSEGDTSDEEDPEDPEADLFEEEPDGLTEGSGEAVLNGAAEISYFDPTDSVQPVKTCTNYHELTLYSTTWNNRWYVAIGEVTIENRINVTGTVNLIVTDGAVLNALQGIRVPSGATLNIWGQEEGTGVLNATGCSYGAGIGGGIVTFINGDGSCGTITINGAVVSASGGERTAGIGGGVQGRGGVITVNGGKVTAVGGEYGAGIGGGYGGVLVEGGDTGPSDGGVITINGGEIEATGSLNAAGIGGGYLGSGGTVTINGGKVKASTEGHAAGIGGGIRGSVGNVTINGGEVEAFPQGIGGAGIGSGSNGFSQSDTISEGCVTINGGAVTAKGADEGAGIGGGSKADGCRVIINGGTVTATGGSYYCPGIGGGYAGNGGAVTITGGTVTVTAAVYGRQAIGSGNPSGSAGNYREGSLTIDYDAKVTTKDPGEDTTYVAQPGKRIEACRNPYAVIEPCLHSFVDGSCEWCGKPTAISYVDTSGTVCSREEYTTVDWTMTRFSSGWYAVRRNVTLSERVSISGTVDLILCDGATLNAEKGIHVPEGQTLNIWRQESGTGSLKATAESGAGIGGNDNEKSGTIAVNGGQVTAEGGGSGAGIGGGKGGGCGNVIINGSTVTATGGSGAAGIGGGEGGSGGIVVITSGTVTATGGSGAAGIGGGQSGSGGKVTVNSGTVKAEGGDQGAGIGGGQSGKGADVTVNDGVVTAVAGSGASGLGGGAGGSDGTLTIGFYGKLTAGADEGSAAPVAIADRAAGCRQPFTKIDICRRHEVIDGICSLCGKENLVGHSLTGEGTGESPFLITCLDDWNDLARYTAEGGITEGIFFRQTADLSAVTTMLGTADYPFAGSYNGGGNALEVQIASSEESCAPFSYVGGGEIVDLSVTGTVSGTNYCAGLIGTLAGGDTFIKNCLVGTAVTASGAHAGGVVGSGGNASASLEGIAFTGSISGGTYVGGLLGWSDGASVSMKNCVESGRYSNVVNFNPVGLGETTWKGIYGICYFNSAVGTPDQNWTGEGNRFFSITAGQDVSVEFQRDTSVRYGVSGIEAPYSSDASYLKFAGTMYAKAHYRVSIVIRYTGTEFPPELAAFTASAGGLEKHETYYYLDMPEEDVTINAGEGELPAFMLKLQDKNLTTGETSPWQNVAVLNLGIEDNTYKLTTVLPADLNAFNNFSVILRAEADPGVIFRSEKELYHISINGKRINSDTNDYGTFHVTRTIARDQHSFEIKLNWSSASFVREVAGATIEVDSVLELTKDAVMGKQGNQVRATALCTSNPANSGTSNAEYSSRGEDYIMIYSHELTFRKVDESGNPVKGARFSLKQILPKDRTRTISNKRKTDDGIFTYYGLDVGEYILTETTTPAGWLPITPIKITISEDWDTVIEDISNTDTIIKNLRGTAQSEPPEDENSVTAALVLTADEDLIGLSGTLVNSYGVLVEEPEAGGTVTADKETAACGETVKLTALPDDGYGLSTLTVSYTDKNGEEQTIVPVRDAANENLFAFDMPAANVKIKAEFTEIFKTQSLVLSGQIGINFYLDLSGLTDSEREGSYMTFEITGKGTTTEKDAFDAGHRNSTGTLYGFTCYVNSIQMADRVTATFHYGSGKTASKTYSVEEYINYFDDHASEFDEKTINLIRALADYGHYAQLFLKDTNGWTFKDYAQMTKHYTESYDAGEVLEAVSGSPFLKNIDGSKITNVRYRLILSSETTLEIAFYVEEGTELSASAVFNGKSFPAEKTSEDRFLIRVSGIPATLLGETITVNGTAGSGFTMSLSAMSYVRAVLSSDTYKDNVNARNAVAALYQYYAASKAYGGSN